jgi:predicted MFS family arabinose efflux permease
VLRRRAACQACMFGAFTAYWTAIAYELIDAHQLSQTGIAIFALVGAAGAASAPLAGRLGDGGHGRLASVSAIVLGAVAMVLADVGAANLILLGLAAVLLDVAVQGHQVLSQREIYQLRADARARINTVYMGTVFIGGAICSAVTGVLHDHGGWTAVTLFGAALPVVALAIWTWGAVRTRTSRSAVDVTGHPGSTLP